MKESKKSLWSDPQERKVLIILAVLFIVCVVGFLGFCWYIGIFEFF